MDIDNILLIRLHFGKKDKLMLIQSSVGGFSESILFLMSDNLPRNVRHLSTGVNFAIAVNKGTN